jgi:hypothetical protein
MPTGRTSTPDSELSRLLDSGLAHLKQRQAPDALWHSPSLGGPLHTSLGLLATNLLGEEDSLRFTRERTLVENMLADQALDGGFLAYSGGPSSRPSTRLVLLALQVFGQHHREALERAPELRTRMEQAERRARGFLHSSLRTEEPGSGFFKAVADLLCDAIDPEHSRTLPVLPGTPGLARMLLELKPLEPARHRISMFFVQAMPAFTVLFHKAAERSRWVRATQELRRGSRSMSALEGRILALQEPGGAWMWTVMGTTLNLLALRALGHGPSHPAIRRGIAYIERLRVPNAEGRLVQAWCHSEVWDTVWACDTLLVAGERPEALRGTEVVERVLEQQRGGYWAYGNASSQGENDSTALVVACLAKLARGLEGKTREALVVSVRHAVTELLRAQQRDGGWGYSPAPYSAPYSYGPRVPSGSEANLIDASTADVTARVLLAFQAVEASSLLEAGLAAQVRDAARRGLEFLRHSQTPTGSWWGRWRAGYLSSLPFVTPALRAGGEPEGSACFAAVRDFLFTHQNTDGGWGDGTEADRDATKAGRGTSTPLQTASALIALVATAPGQELGNSVPLRRGIDSLARSQRFGTWSNGRALYTAAFQADYYDSPLGTHTMVTRALTYISLAKALGIDAATRRLVCGESLGEPQASGRVLRGH